MILIEIIESLNPDRLGEYPFYKDSISFGTHSNDEILIIEAGILNSHSRLIIDENKLSITLNEEIDFIHINGKRTTSSKRLKINDHIKIGQTTIKVISFSMEINISRKEFLNNRVTELQNKQSPLLTLLQDLNQ